MFGREEAPKLDITQGSNRIEDDDWSPTTIL